MASLTTTAVAGTSAASVTIVIDWLLSGHPMVNGAFPEDIQLILVACVAFALHAIQVIGAGAINMLVKKFAPELEPVVEEVIPDPTKTAP